MENLWYVYIYSPFYLLIVCRLKDTNIYINSI